MDFLTPLLAESGKTRAVAGPCAKPPTAAHCPHNACGPMKADAIQAITGLGVLLSSDSLAAAPAPVLTLRICHDKNILLPLLPTSLYLVIS